MATSTLPVSNRRKSPTAKPKRRFPPETLTDAEVRSLLGACPATSASGIRNTALIAILPATSAAGFPYWADMQGSPSACTPMAFATPTPRNYATKA